MIKRADRRRRHSYTVSSGPIVIVFFFFSTARARSTVTSQRRNTHEHRLGSCTAPLHRRSAFVLVTTRQSSNRAPSPFTATRNESSRAPSFYSRSHDKRLAVCRFTGTRYRNKPSTFRRSQRPSVETPAIANVTVIFVFFLHTYVFIFS